MSRILLFLGLALSVAACGRDEPEAPPATPTPAPASAAKSETPVVAPVSADEAQLRRVCRAGIAAIHGQQLAAITIDGVEEGIVDASWRAPVDGGARRAQCRIDGDMIIWKPLDRPEAAQNRWMNAAGDPLVRFVADDRKVRVTTTLPNGTTVTEDYAVAAAREAA